VLGEVPGRAQPVAPGTGSRGAWPGDPGAARGGAAEAGRM